MVLDAGERVENKAGEGIVQPLVGLTFRRGWGVSNQEYELSSGDLAPSPK